MRTSLDTTVLIAGLHRGHPLHQAAIVWLEKATESPKQFGVCQHGVAEVYAVLTNAPAPMRVSTIVALQLLNELNVTVVPIDPEDYSEAITRLAAGGLAGGIVYDMLHVVAAEKFGSERLVTANEHDFRRLPTKRPIEIVGLVA